MTTYAFVRTSVAEPEEPRNRNKLPPGAETAFTNYGSGYGGPYCFIKDLKIFYSEKVMVRSIHVRKYKKSKKVTFKVPNKTICDK
jgi:hypothetical protein